MKTQTSIVGFWRYSFVAVGFLILGGTCARADYKSTVLSDSPLAFYALNPGTDGTNNAPDLTGNGNDGAPYAITSAVGPSAYITNAAAFNGSNSLVDLSEGGNPGLLNFSGPITLEVWVQPANSTEFGDILAKGYDASTYQEIVLRVNGPYGGNFYGSSGSSGQNGGTQTTTWSHVVLSSDGTNCSLYIDGGLVSQSGDTSGSQTFNDDWVIGNGSSAGNTRLFSGNISEVAIYNYGLSAAQVQNHFLVGRYGTTNLTPNNLRWSATANTGIWDTGNLANWINTANSQQTNFNFGDVVLFDDTAGVPTNVTVNGSVSPQTLVVNSSANNYNFSGTGALAGPGGLTKSGSSTLVINTPGHPTGPVSILGGYLYAGNNCFRNVASIVVTNNAALDVGGGNLLNNTPVTVSGTGVANSGAILNTYSDDPGESVNVALAGDTKFGGSARWDLNSGSQIAGPHDLVLDLSAGANYQQWNSVTVGADLAGIFVTNSSALGMTGADNACQNPGTLFTVSTNCQLIFYSGGFNGSVHVLGGGVMYHYSAPSGFTGTSLTFENNSSFQSYYNTGQTTSVDNAITLNGVAHFVVGDHNMIYTNQISGAGGFVLDYYNNQMVMSASNTYTGPTIIGSPNNNPAVALTGNGSISHSSLIFFGGNNPSVVHVDVSGRPDDTLTLASGQTLGGVGYVNGNLTVSPGATVAPAGTNTTIGITTGTNATGGIYLSGTLTLGGTTSLKLNGSGNCDQIFAGNIMFGGTLNLVNISGAPLAAGNSFQVFSGTGYSGSFATITPATPGRGLTWDTSQLNTSGVLNVALVQQPVIASTTVSGGNIVLSGTNGSNNAVYYVLTSASLTTPLTNWVRISTNTMSGTGTFSITNAVTPGATQQYFIINQQ
jgi:autotransporter-associated beta strand protein